MNGTSAQAQARLAYLCDEIQRLARRHSSLRIIAMDSLTDLLARMEQQTSSSHTSVPSSARGQQNQTTPSKTASSRKKQFFEPSPEVFLKISVCLSCYLDLIFPFRDLFSLHLGHQLHQNSMPLKHQDIKLRKRLTNFSY